MRKAHLIAGWLAAILGMSGLGLHWGAASAFGEPAGAAPRWVVSEKGTVLEIAYGAGTKTPQYGALHLESGYFRLVSGPDSGWGTSVILLPSFWEGGKLYQGAPVTATHVVSGEGDLVLTVKGRISSLDVETVARLVPPFKDLMSAVVSVRVEGNVVLDKRPGEAFKPVVFSSMHISGQKWDCLEAWTGAKTYPIPGEGWIISRSVRGADLGLRGGTSAWKKNAPTVAVRLDRHFRITGWVTKSANPNDDNVGFWAAADQLIRSWRYLVLAGKEYGQ